MVVMSPSLSQVVQISWFNVMLTNSTLWIYLGEIDEQASEMFSRLVEQMNVNEGITEQLKEENQMEW